MHKLTDSNVSPLDLVRIYTQYSTRCHQPCMARRRYYTYSRPRDYIIIDMRHVPAALVLQVGQPSALVDYWSESALVAKAKEKG